MFTVVIVRSSLKLKHRTDGKYRSRVSSYLRCEARDVLSGYFVRAFYSLFQTLIIIDSPCKRNVRSVRLKPAQSSIGTENVCGMIAIELFLFLLEV